MSFINQQTWVTQLSNSASQAICVSDCFYTVRPFLVDSVRVSLLQTLDEKIYLLNCVHTLGFQQKKSPFVLKCWWLLSYNSLTLQKTWWAQDSTSKSESNKYYKLTSKSFQTNHLIPFKAVMVSLTAEHYQTKCRNIAAWRSTWCQFF